MDCWSMMVGMYIITIAAKKSKEDKMKTKVFGSSSENFNIKATTFDGTEDVLEAENLMSTLQFAGVAHNIVNVTLLR